jgi:hypothetical protein
MFNDFGFKTIAEISEVIHSRGYNFHLFEAHSETNPNKKLNAWKPSATENIQVGDEGATPSFEMIFEEFRRNLKKSIPEIFVGNAYGVGASELTPTLAYFLDSDLSTLSAIFDSTPSKFHKFMPGINPPILPWSELMRLNSNDDIVVLAPSVASEISAALSRMNLTKIWVPDFGNQA